MQSFFVCFGLRANSGLLLHEPSARLRKTLGHRSFTSAAPTLWEKLPVHLRNMDNFTNFKSSLKTHLFRIAFNVGLDHWFVLML